MNLRSDVLKNFMKEVFENKSQKSKAEAILKGIIEHRNYDKLINFFEINTTSDSTDIEKSIMNALTITSIIKVCNAFSGILLHPLFI